MYTLKGYKTNIEKDTLDNNNFRKVLYTSKHVQLVLMTLRPGEEIGEEVHNENDQFFRIEGGHGKCIIDGHEYDISDGDAIVIPTGSKQNIVNIDKTDLRMYTLYAPPHHKDGILRPTKREAEENEAEFDGKTTE